LWEEWRSPEGQVLRTCTIITVEPNELISQFHHRMAVILRPEAESVWLNLKNPATEALQLLKPYPSEEMEAYPVSRAVNSPSFDEISCIMPIGAGD
jgi:putative SOS response-associated peptidase YedK